MRDLFYPSGFGFGLKQRSPIKEEVNKWIKRSLYFGLNEEWIQKSIENNKENTKDSGSNLGDIEESLTLNLNHMEGPFLILGLGFIFGLISLVFEVFNSKRFFKTTRYNNTT